MDEAQILCDDVAIMDKGRIIERGSPDALLQKHFTGVMVDLPKQNLEGKAIALPYIENGDRIEFMTEQVDDTLQQLMSLHISLYGMQVKSANLEDLFLKLTGHALRG